MFVDSHCHLDFPQFDGRREILLQDMRRNGVSHALCVSVALEGFPAVLALAQANENLRATVGIHPNHREGREASVEELCRLAERPEVVAIGETGLDYYRQGGEREWQQHRFRVHIRAARACGKPLVIHTRQAAGDTLDILEAERANEAGGVMHCFSESWSIAQRALDLGFHISFSGIVTFRNATALKDVARRVPLDRMLIETDAPYLAPEPHRGKVNEPAYVVHVAEEIARLKDLSRETVGRATADNYFALFGIADSHSATS